jgi:hypothetical protein
MFLVTYFVILIAALIGVFVMLLRNELVFRIRRRRIDAISDACQRDLGRPDFGALLNARYAELDSPSYGQMVSDLRRWTYRQFYPQEVK